MAACYKYSLLRNYLALYTLCLSAESLEIVELELGTHVHVHSYLCTHIHREGCRELSALYEETVF